MMPNSKQILDEIRSRISIVNLVSEHLPLKRAGRNFKGLCPFHQEKTPSFMVTEEKQIFHCFGCGEGGDVFTFLMKYNGLTFPEALKELAKKAGVKLPAYSESSREASKEWTQKKEWALRLNQIASEYFTSKNYAVKKYLAGRGIRPETIRAYGLGYADSGWDGLAQKFSQAKAPLKLAEELGLIRKRPNEEGYYDFFRDRLIFSIQDIQGNVIGFGGRSLDEGQDPKYLNSADSFLYHKSKTVYGLNFARGAIRRQDEVIWVEGYMDALSLWQAGVENAVAPLGTALTMDHLRILSRYTKNMVLAFDGDAAGRQAAFRALPLFLELELTPKLMLFPDQEDPDSFMQNQGKEAWEKFKTKTPTLFEARIEVETDGATKDTQKKIRAWETLKPLLAMVRNPVEAGIYRKKIAEQLGMDESWLKSSPKNTIRNAQYEQRNEFSQEEQLLIAAMLLEPKTIPAIQQAGVDFAHPHLQKFSTQLFEQYAETGQVSVAAFQEELEENLGRWIRELSLTEGEPWLWQKVVTDCLNKKASKKLEMHLKMLNEKIARAEQEGNEEEMLKLIAQKRKLLEEKHYGRSGKGD